MSRVKEKSKPKTKEVEPKKSCLKFYSLFTVLISIGIAVSLSNLLNNDVQILSTKDERPSEKKQVEVVLQEEEFVNYSTVNYRSYYNNNELKHKSQIDEADELVLSGNFKMAKKKYQDILDLLPHSPRCVYGQALIMDKLSEIEKSNKKLKYSIDFYKKLFEEPILSNVISKEFHVMAGLRLVNRLNFYGKHNDAVLYNEKLSNMYPDDVQLQNELGIAYILTNKAVEAKRQFENILDKSPNNPVALVHLGFVLKQFYKQNNESIHYLQRGIDSMDKRVMDSRFFFHLGDALQRAGENEKAYQYYSIAAQKGLFLSPYQRSIYNVESLKAQPWWSIEETDHEKSFKEIQEHWMAIRDEGLSLIDSKTKTFVAEDENLREKGDWQQFTLYMRGKKLENNCKRAPVTCKLVDKFVVAKTCTRGQVKFSVMYPIVHVWPHCGPTNCRLRSHLGLKIPDGAYMRVGNETKQWTEGKFIVFDDSFEHEVWHNGTDLRLVLIIDFWHPELMQNQIEQLSPI